MHLSEEKVEYDCEDPEEDIIREIVHGIGLFEGLMQIVRYMFTHLRHGDLYNQMVRDRIIFMVEVGCLSKN